MTVIYIEEWLWRQSLRRHIHRNGGQCWHPIRQLENGNWELERVYDVPDPVCVLRERTDDPQNSQVLHNNGRPQKWGFLLCITLEENGDENDRRLR